MQLAIPPDESSCNLVEKEVMENDCCDEKQLKLIKHEK